MCDPVECIAHDTVTMPDASALQRLDNDIRDLLAHGVDPAAIICATACVLPIERACRELRGLVCDCANAGPPLRRRSSRQPWCEAENFRFDHSWDVSHPRRQLRTPLLNFAFASPAGWTLAKSLSEKPAQMRLIRKSHAQRDFAQRSWTGYHQMTGFFQSPLDYVSVWRFSEGQLERPREVRRASPRDGAEILGMNGSVQVLVDERSHPRDLPAGQSRGSGSPRARITLDLRLQDDRGGGQRCLRRLAIALELAPCHFNKLGQAVRQQIELMAGRRRIRCSTLRPIHVNPSTSIPARARAWSRPCRLAC